MMSKGDKEGEKDVVLALHDSFAWTLEFILKMMEFSRFSLIREILKDLLVSHFSLSCQQ